MSKSDRRYLERHGAKWRVVVPVPRSLHPVLGTKLKRSLNTDSLATASQLKWAVVQQLKKEITRQATGKADDPLTAEALALRASIEQATDDRARQDVIDYIAARADEIAGDPIETVSDSGERAFEYDSEQASIAGTFSRLATGESTPLRSFVEQWHGQASRHPRSMRDDERALDLLDAWCRANQVDPAIEAITRKVAGRFIGGLLDDGAAARKLGGAGRTARTINKYISSLSGYWKWLKRRGHVDENVWREQSLPKAKGAEGSARSFTDDEVLKLLNGQTSECLHDLMRIAALSDIPISEGVRNDV